MFAPPTSREQEGQRTFYPLQCLKVTLAYSQNPSIEPARAGLVLFFSKYTDSFTGAKTSAPSLCKSPKLGEFSLNEGSMPNKGKACPEQTQANTRLGKYQETTLIPGIAWHLSQSQPKDSWSMTQYRVRALKSDLSHTSEAHLSSINFSTARATMVFSITYTIIIRMMGEMVLNDLKWHNFYSYMHNYCFL